MEYLGYTHRKPSIGKNGKWNPLDIEFTNSDEFNEATSKIMNILYKDDSDGKCLVLDGKGNDYHLEIIHATFNTQENIIRVFPHDCRFSEPKQKSNSAEKKNNASAKTTA